ncbi:hypothetical protein [Cellulomonas phragmiteti]|uniref:hypothetical protein n=1 Tax=Cellulomonas phragmiteti TaxID=478780 RepID=UPI001EF29535|nr:hypothetical protein [Cellulomonas phragmiteti]
MTGDGSAEMMRAEGRISAMVAVTSPDPAPMSRTGPCEVSRPARAVRSAGALETRWRWPTRSKNSAAGE